MAKEEDDDLPDKDAAKEFYAKYEPKEIIGRWERSIFGTASVNHQEQTWFLSCEAAKRG